jgi:hypothetical protein
MMSLNQWHLGHDLIPLAKLKRIHLFHLRREVLACIQQILASRLTCIGEGAVSQGIPAHGVYRRIPNFA